MKILYKIIAITLLLVFASSCVINGGIRGNGNIETQKRNVSKDFTSIKVSQGIKVYLTTNERVSVNVEADENIIDLIETEVHDGVLKISLSKNVWRSNKRKVYVSASTITSIRTSSGASVRLENTLKADRLDLRASSGSDIRGTVRVSDLEADTSSGADIRLSGTAENFDARASSGSNIRAFDLEAEYVKAKASSGADIRVNASKDINARASSGGDVKYRGEAKRINSRKSVSGSVHRD